MMSRLIIVGLFFLFTTSLFADTPTIADKVIVKKSTRMLYLSKEGKIYKQYHIILSKIATGPKEFEGDMKTPEGVYFLDWRQLSPLYNKSIHISYPNQADKAKAKQFGVSPGGMVMIHGTPLNWSLSPIGDWMPMLVDWTEGCIAMGNNDMEEVWEQTSNGIPIIILP